MNDWNAQIIAEFRASGGKAAQFGDNPLVILHTIGAKSGELRETPLVALVEGDDLYVFASKGGAPTHPDWYFNLLSTPRSRSSSAPRPSPPTSPNSPRTRARRSCGHRPN